MRSRELSLTNLCDRWTSPRPEGSCLRDRLTARASVRHTSGNSAWPVRASVAHTDALRWGRQDALRPLPE